MKHYLSYGLGVLLLLGLPASCKKDEYIPPPEGEKIPYVDPNYKTLEETLKTSPYQLFLKVYLRSNMDSVLKARSFHTLLVPTDAAMQAAGYTDAAITALTAFQADSLVALHTLRGNFTREELALSAGNREGVSLLTHANSKLHVIPYYYGNGTPNTSYDTYYYRHYLIASGEDLLINALPSGALMDALPASNGYIYPIKQVLPRAVDKSFWEVLAGDPRFSMFLAIQQQADLVFDTRYRQTVEEAIGWDPGGYGWIDPRRTDYHPLYALEISPYDGTTGLIFSTMFAPTNEAFHRAGFDNVEQVMAWNEQYASPAIFDWNTYEVGAFGFPSDTVLAYHWDFGRDNLPYSGLYGKAPSNSPTVFYANDLRNEYLGDYLVNQYSNFMQYAMPFSFGRSSNGKPTVQVKGSSAAPATVTETINTIMGPLHVVDRLLIPNNLKMN